MGVEKNIQLKAWDGRFVSQDEAQYTTLSSTPGQACANCRWFSASYDACMIVENYPQPILATGHSNRWEATPQEVMPDVEPIPVVIVEPVMTYELEEMALKVPKNLVQQVRDYVGKLFNPVEKNPPAFQVFKAANGRNAWIARYSGKFIDRQDEIIADESNERFAQRVQSGAVPMPELWMWHNKATKHGQAVYVWKADGFMCAVGYFEDTPKGQKAFEYYQKHAGKIKLSHMFEYPLEAKIDGVYYDHNTIEITTLPDGAEAFPYTSFMELQTMSIPAEGQTMIRESLGEDVLQAALMIDKQAATDTKTLEGQGIASKQFPGSPVVALSDQVKALETEQAAKDARLKQLEDTVAKLGDIPAAITQLSDSIKLLTDQVTAAQKGENTALEQVNDLQKKLAELSDVSAPASQAQDTLLSDREKSLVDNVLNAAKSDNSLSLVEKLMDGQPFISTP